MHDKNSTKKYVCLSTNTCTLKPNLRSAMASSVLSLSGPKLRCAEVIQLMLKMGLTGDVTQNTSVLPGGELETGCRVQLTKDSTAANGGQAIFSELKSRGKVKCAHVEERHHASGCVFDVWRESACPAPRSQSPPTPPTPLTKTQ